MSDADLGWRLRLLASIDLVGSTALKQREPAATLSDLPEWRLVIDGFYHGFLPCLAQQYAELESVIVTMSGPPAPIPTLWKYNGDEILTEVVLADHRQVLAHTMALKQAVATFQDWWQHNAPHKEPFPLGLKAAAWLAGFPVTNHEVPPVTAPTGPHDYIGPQIDLGFRLRDHATRRRLVLDALLAEMVCTAMGNAKYPELMLRYGGRCDLRGVLRGEPYPLIWLDVACSETALEDGLLPGPEPPGNDKIGRFLRWFIDQTPGLRPPFIADDDAYPFDPKRDADLDKMRRLIQDYAWPDYEKTFVRDDQLPAVKQRRQPDGEAHEKGTGPV